MNLILSIWTLPNTLLGIALARLLGATNAGVYWRVRPGHRLASLWHARTGFTAVALGTVIICYGSPSCDVLLHARRHVRQALLLGPLYIPLYLTLCLWGLLLPGRHWYADHPMEVHASGG